MKPGDKIIVIGELGGCKGKTGIIQKVAESNVFPYQVLLDDESDINHFIGFMKDEIKLFSMDKKDEQILIPKYEVKTSIESEFENDLNRLALMGYEFVCLLKLSHMLLHDDIKDLCKVMTLQPSAIGTYVYLVRKFE
jgi:hypothetical protein